MKNIQVFDGAENATFSIFQATEEEFAALFPLPGQDIEFIDDAIRRLGRDIEKYTVPLWSRPVRKSDAMGIHGTLFYQWGERKHYFPKSKREIDTPTSWINQPQCDLFKSLGGQPADLKRQRLPRKRPPKGRYAPFAPRDP